MLFLREHLSFYLLIEKLHGIIVLLETVDFLYEKIILV